MVYSVEFQKGSSSLSSYLFHYYFFFFNFLIFLLLNLITMIFSPFFFVCLFSFSITYPCDKKQSWSKISRRKSELENTEQAIRYRHVIILLSFTFDAASRSTRVGGNKQWRVQFVRWHFSHLMICEAESATIGFRLATRVSFWCSKCGWIFTRD